MILLWLIIEAWVSILLILAFIPIFRQAGAELDLVRIIAEFIQRLFW